MSRTEQERSGPTCRTENFGAGVTQITQWSQVHAARRDVAAAYPLHPGPTVSGVIHAALAGYDSIVLIYSGGIGEEMLSRSKPVLECTAALRGPRAWWLEPQCHRCRSGSDRPISQLFARRSRCLQ